MAKRERSKNYPDTTVFQDMADAMLRLFDDMPQVLVLVADHIRFAPQLQHRLRKIRKALAIDSKRLTVVIGFSVVLITSFLNKAHLIPEAVASFVWCGWTIAILVLYAVSAIRHRTR